MKANVDQLQVNDADEGKQNPDGTPAISSWSFRDADQMEKHLRGIDDAGHPMRKLSKGDRSAIRDAANEYQKQRNS